MNTFFLFDLPLSYGSLTKMVQQTKTLCLIQITSFSLNVMQLAYNSTMTIRLSSKAKNY